MNIQFINTSQWGIKKKNFNLSIERLKKHVPEVDGILNVVFVDDVYIEFLNRTYRNKEESTDVLSFSYMDENGLNDDKLIGEIYISVSTAKRQAEEFEVTLKYELNKLFVHGFLHIYGHKHDSEKDFKKMNKIEKEVLSE